MALACSVHYQFCYLVEIHMQHFLHYQPSHLFCHRNFSFSITHLVTEALVVSFQPLPDQLVKKDIFMLNNKWGGTSMLSTVI